MSLGLDTRYKTRRVQPKQLQRARETTLLPCPYQPKWRRRCRWSCHLHYRHAARSSLKSASQILVAANYFCSCMYYVAALLQRQRQRHWKPDVQTNGGGEEALDLTSSSVSESHTARDSRNFKDPYNFVVKFQFQRFRLETLCELTQNS
jgi:hypothetical protein